VDQGLKSRDEIGRRIELFADKVMPEFS